MPVSNSNGPSIVSVFWLRVLFSMARIVVVTRLLVGLVHKFDGVANAQLHSREARACADVHLAAWIAGGEYGCVRLAHVVQLFFQNSLRHLRLHQVVNTGSAAAAFAAVQRDKLITDHRAKHTFGSLAAVLAVQEMTRGIVSHAILRRRWRVSHS